jgi:peptidase E
MNAQKPLYLLAGGHFDKPRSVVPMLESILAASGQAKPHVAYVGAANGDRPAFFSMMRDLLTSAGAAQVTPVPLAKAKADVEQARLTLARVDAVFVSGGDVEEGMRWLSRHQLLAFFNELYARGTLFFGLSAGSIMLGRQWVRWTDPQDDDTAALYPCLELAPVVCDTHAEDDDWEELQVAVELLGDRGMGYGIPSGGMLRIDPDGAINAMGASVVRYENTAGTVKKSADLAASEQSRPSKKARHRA